MSNRGTRGANRGRRALTIVALAAAAVALGVSLPGPIRPLAWSPPSPPPLAGVLAANHELERVELVGEGRLPGPEDVAVDAGGRLYCGVAGDVGGSVWRLTEEGRGWRIETLAVTDGRPLGLDLAASGTLWVAASELGLVAIEPSGRTRVRADRAAGRPVTYANDVDTAPDGTVYFTDSSTFDAARIRLDPLEARPHGRLLRHSPASDTVEVLLDDLYFANGVAVADDGSYLLVAETFRYRLRRYWLRGPRAGESEVLIENLPGFPDGVSADGHGGFWLALFARRSELLDRVVHPRAWLKRLIARLPAGLLSSAEPYGLVLSIDPDGRVIRSLHDPDGARFGNVTSVEESGGSLYLGSVDGTAIGRYRLN